MFQRTLSADRILIGDVVTLDGKGTRAEAIAIRDGLVLDVGTRDAVLGRRDGATQIDDFGRAAIIPGFNDTHAHMDTEGMKLVRPALAGARSVADVVSRIAELARGRPKGSWIVTMPVGDPPFYFGGPLALAERRMPTRQELDRAAPDHPVCILPPSGYWGKPPCYSALNSLGLKLNGIARDTAPRLPGIEIVKDAAGEPTGVFVDHNPRESVQLDLMPAVPRFTTADRQEAVRAAMRLYHTKGTTSIYEGHGCTPEVIDLYRRLWEAGELTMRIGMVVAPPWASAAEAEPIMRDWLGHARGRGLGDAKFRISGIHITHGGDPFAAQLARALGNDTGYWSHLWQANDPAQFEALCLLAAKYDLRVHTIASTIKQIPDVVAILQRVHAQCDLRRRRWVVEHVSASKPEHLDAFKDMGMGVTLIPSHHLWKGGAQFFDLAEPDAAHVVPAKPLLERGVPVAGGTDNTPYDPLTVMRTLMLREERTTGRAIGPAARLSAEQALAAVTAAGAWFTFEENAKGRLMPGYMADCAVLSANPLEVPPQAFDTIACRATMVGGEFVFRD